MMTDPRESCANARELWFWAAVHDLIAHPLMVLTWYSGPALAFHDFTSHRAWPREPQERPSAEFITGFGRVRVVHCGGDFWRVYHGRVNHAVTVKARDEASALVLGQDWFWNLAQEFGGKFRWHVPKSLKGFL